MRNNVSTEHEVRRRRCAKKMALVGGGGSEACRCRPWCGGIINPGWGSSPSPDDDRNGRADNPGQKVVRQRPQPVEYVKTVKSEVDRCVLAGESAAPLPAALRYGTGLETRPIFTRTVCHSRRTKHRPALIDGWGCTGPSRTNRRA